MGSHFADPGIYIRSMATRGSLGGLARTTADVTSVLDASGRDVILIETVGVGQDEVDIVRLAEVTVVILVPGMGDDVQTIKAGIMEIADIFVINKSDREGAERVEREVRAMQSLAAREDNWTPPIVKTVATAEKALRNFQPRFRITRSSSRVRGWRIEKRSETGESACWKCCAMPPCSKCCVNTAKRQSPATPPKLRITSATRILIEEIVGSTKEKASALR